jgi:Holliday junction resolvase
MYKHGRVDTNHGEIVDALRKCGWLVHDTSSQGNGFPDLVCSLNGKVFLAEVKFSRGKLTHDQSEFKKAGWPFAVLRSTEDVVAWTEKIRK